MTWCNVELEKINDTSYRLSYVNSNGQEVNLKSPAFNIIDKQNIKRYCAENKIKHINRFSYHIKLNRFVTV